MYIERGIDWINLSSAFNYSTSISQIPPHFDNTKPTFISYSYTKITQQKLIFNYKSTISEINIENKAPSTWDCDTSRFRYVHIFEDSEVKTLLKKEHK